MSQPAEQHHAAHEGLVVTTPDGAARRNQAGGAKGSGAQESDKRDGCRGLEGDSAASGGTATSYSATLSRQCARSSCCSHLRRSTLIVKLQRVLKGEGCRRSSSTGPRPAGCTRCW